MTIAATSTAMQDIVDNAEERELWIVGREFERPPYFHAGKGGDTRLARALRLCIDEKITPNSDGSYQVEGSHGRSYRVADSCSCPHSQSSKSKYCYHFVAVCLYIEWKRRIHPAAPVALGTLRPGTLPLPPVTMDERLAQRPAFNDEDLEARDMETPHTPEEDRMASQAPREEPLPLGPTTVEERLAQAASVAMDHVHSALGTMRDATALSTHHTPQEDRMADDEYIPEPNDDDAPVTVLEPPVATPAPRPLPGPVLLPSLDAESLKRSMQEWSAQRQVIRSFLQQELKEGVDFYRLQVRGKDANPTLSKAGAEKFLGLFQLQASFMPDIGTWEMLGKPIDLVSYVCTLMTRNGEVVGEGRGARSLKKDGGDANKAIKMAEKSALIDAVLRTGALSEVYTQDVEDLQEEPAKSAPVKPNPLHPSAELRQRIWSRVQALAPDVRTREAVEAFIKERTGMDLHPDLFHPILARLEERA